MKLGEIQVRINCLLLVIGRHFTFDLYCYMDTTNGFFRLLLLDFHFILTVNPIPYKT